MVKPPPKNLLTAMLALLIISKEMRNRAVRASVLAKGESKNQGYPRIPPGFRQWLQLQ